MTRATFFLLLAGLASACGARQAPASCPAVDEEALAAAIADDVYERLRREGYVPGGAGAATSTQEPVEVHAD